MAEQDHGSSRDLSPAAGAGLEAQLLSCPFCGGDQISTGHIRDGRSCGCSTCGASIRAYNGPTSAEGRVRAAWNRRSRSVDASTPSPDGWRDIASAPKDGTPILAIGPVPVDGDVEVRETYWHFYGEGSIAKAAFDRGEGSSGNWRWAEPAHNWAQEWKPTHWMPLPPLPAEGRAADRSGEAASALSATDALPLPTADIEGLIAELHARANARHTSDEPSPTAKLCAEAASALRSQAQRIAKYRERLEIDHVWRMVGAPSAAEMECVPVDHDNTPDGIECRDETIRLLEETNAKLKARASRAEERLGEAVKPITMQDVRLAVGEGLLRPADILAGCNAELRRRSALSSLKDQGEGK